MAKISLPSGDGKVIVVVGAELVGATDATVVGAAIVVGVVVVVVGATLVDGSVAVGAVSSSLAHPAKMSAAIARVDKYFVIM